MNEVAPTSTGPDPVAPRRRAGAAARRQGADGPWFAVAAFGAVAAVLFLVVWQTNVHAGPGPEAGGGVRSFAEVDDALEAWLQYDAGWYITIADHGYSYIPGQQSSVAFFPAFPLAVRAVAGGLESTPLAAIATTFACGLGAALLFWRWCAARLGPAGTRTAVVALLASPYAWFLYGSGYGDALFLAAGIGAFLLLERDHAVLAGLAGFVATATRPNGVAVLVGLVAVALERRGVLVRGGPRQGEPHAEPTGAPTAARTALRVGLARERSRWRLDRRRLRLSDSGVLLAAGGIASYCAYLWVRFGDPIAFVTVQSAPGWDQGEGPATWFKRSFFALVLRGEADYGARLVAQALLTLAVVVAVPFVVRRFGWGYGLYVLVAIGIPALGSSTFQGLGRYCLAAFPCFALAGAWLAERPRARAPALAGSALVLVALTSLYARGYYLS